MNKTLERYQNSAFRQLIKQNSKYAPILFFIGGFVFDTLTLGRIDRTYDKVMLCIHMTSLTFTLYLFNRANDGKWKHTFLERIEAYFPLAIQFFFGALSSAYVIYFSRSVSLSKTATFFAIIILLFIANEFLKKRIANKYLQFGVYFFISFTFFAFMIPVLVKEMSTRIFLISGAISMVSTIVLILYIYQKSPSSRKEIKLGKLLIIIISIYAIINLFYFQKLIPPVPLALDQGIVAHDIKVEEAGYLVTYEPNNSYVFWRKHKATFNRYENEPVFIFSSIFAPTNLQKQIIHRWKWYDKVKEEWKVMDNIGYTITGGRDDGFRGYTYKNNLIYGNWEVDVITDDEHLLGTIQFTIVTAADENAIHLKTEKF